MWDTLSHPWQVCIEQAWSAYCAGSIPIGAVVTDNDGRILSTGRNRQFDRQEDDEQYQISNHRLAHAEINALLGFDYRENDPHTCVLYTTTEPCPLCVGALCMANVRELHFASRDPWCGSTELLQMSSYLKKQRIKVTGPEQPNLETALVALQVEYHLRAGAERFKIVQKALEAVIPLGVWLGERLYKSDILQRMKSEGIPVPQVLDLISQEVQNNT